MASNPIRTNYFTYFPLPPPHYIPTPTKVTPPPHKPITPPHSPPPATKPPPSPSVRPPPPAIKPPPSPSVRPPPPAIKPPPSPSVRPPPPSPSVRPPPPAIKPPPSPSVRPPPPAIKPPPSPTVRPPPPAPATKPPPSPIVIPPPPHHPFHPPPPPHPISPPSPPHVLPPPPPPPGHPSTVIVIVFVSLGGLFFLAFLSAALFCFLKKNKKKEVQKAEIISIDEHVKVEEAIVPGPHGEQNTVLFIEEDIHIEEEFKTNKKISEGIPQSQQISDSQASDECGGSKVPYLTRHHLPPP